MTSNGLIQNADHLKQASPLIHWPLRRTSMRLLLPSVIGGLALIVFAPVSIAHFRLIEPASWPQESQLGDPQKMAPVPELLWRKRRCRLCIPARPARLPGFPRPRLPVRLHCAARWFPSPTSGQAEPRVKHRPTEF
jgi:hypothetical protein